GKKLLRRGGSTPPWRPFSIRRRSKSTRSGFASIATWPRCGGRTPRRRRDRNRPGRTWPGTTGRRPWKRRARSRSWAASVCGTFFRTITKSWGPTGGCSTWVRSGPPGGFLADLLNRQIGEERYDYLNYYLGTIWLAQRADLGPVYRMIFRRLRGRAFDWV